MKIKITLFLVFAIGFQFSYGKVKKVYNPKIKEKNERKKNNNVKSILQKWASQTFRKSEVLLSIPCKITTKKIEAHGIIVHEPLKKDEDVKLHALIAYKAGKRWNIEVLQKSDENNDMSSTLKIFWNKDKKEFMKGYEFYCITPGSVKNHIVMPNFPTNKFKKDPNYKSNQICYQTDNMMSNFSCFTIPTNGTKPELSHVQAFED